MLLPRIPYGQRSAAAALADHAEAVSVVHVQQRAVFAGDRREGGQVGRVAGHAVDPVHAHQSRAAAARRAAARRGAAGSSKRKRFTVAPRARAIWQPS